MKYIKRYLNCSCKSIAIKVAEHSFPTVFIEGRRGTNEASLAKTLFLLLVMVLEMRCKFAFIEQVPMQRRCDFSGVLYFGWPNQPSSGTMRVYIELLLCTYI